MAEFMLMSVTMRPAGRKLPSLGVYRWVNGLIGLFLGVSSIANNIKNMSLIFLSIPALLIKFFRLGFAPKREYVYEKVFIRLSVQWRPSW